MIWRVVVVADVDPVGLQDDVEGLVVEGLAVPEDAVQVEDDGPEGACGHGCPRSRSCGLASTAPQWSGVA